MAKIDVNANTMIDDGPAVPENDPLEDAPAFDAKKPHAQVMGHQGVHWVQGDWFYNAQRRPVRLAPEGERYSFTPKKKSRKELEAELAKQQQKTIVGKPMEADAEPSVVRDARRENAQALAAEENVG